MLGLGYIEACQKCYSQVGLCLKRLVGNFIEVQHHQLNLAYNTGLRTVQFLIVCSMLQVIKNFTDSELSVSPCICLSVCLSICGVCQSELDGGNEA